jgi:hypothetical protein
MNAGAVLVEDLDAVVLAVADEQASARESMAMCGVR